MGKLKTAPIFSVVILLFVATTTVARVPDPVHWTFAAKKKTADTFEVVLTASVDPPWHIFSQNTGSGGPVPTSIVFKSNPSIVLTGKPKEMGKLMKAFDGNFQTHVIYYSNRVRFVTTVRARGSENLRLVGIVEYQAATDSEVLPPVKRSFDIPLQ